MAVNQTVQIPFSASTQGQGVKLAATATPGTLIHTTGTGLFTTVFDKVFLWAYNSDTVDRVLTIEFGGATAPDQNITMTVPFKQGLIYVVPGLILAGSGSVALTVKGFVTAGANVVVVSGYILRVTV